MSILEDIKGVSLIDSILLTGEQTGKFTIDSKHSKRGDEATFTLEECLDAFSKQEVISGDNKWYCERCKNHVDAINQITLYTLPKYLILQLKRFRQNELEMYTRKDYLHSKISNFVEYPVEGLDLSQYVQNEEYKSKAVYNLWGVIHHMGDMRGGHYIATCKNPLSGEWYEFDDAHVSKTYPERFVTNSGYVLVYERRDSENRENHNSNGRIYDRQDDVDMEYIT